MKKHLPLQLMDPGVKPEDDNRQCHARPDRASMLDHDFTTPIRAFVVALLALTTSAFAQATAFFYPKPVVLDREQHKSLRLKNVDARFAAKNQ